MMAYTFILWITHLEFPLVNISFELLRGVLNVYCINITTAKRIHQLSVTVTVFTVEQICYYIQRQNN